MAIFVGTFETVYQKTTGLLLSLLQVSKDQAFRIHLKKAILNNSEDFLGFLSLFVFCGSIDCNLFAFLLLFVFYGGFSILYQVVEHFTFN